MDDSLQDRLLAEALPHSSGQFTIAREKALEKLALFRLPSESYWCLKIVQAAVAAGASEIKLRQTHSVNEFRLVGAAAWTLEQVEDEFYRVESSPQPGLEHLKQGLWSVSLNDMRPFTLTAPEWSESLAWDGLRLSRQPKTSCTCPVLTISHFPALDRPGLTLRAALAAAKNAEVVRELSLHAFTCPIPLSVDGRRLDSLLLSPLHGFSPTSYPLQLGLLEGDLPPLRVPPGTFGGYQLPPKVDATMRKLFRVQTEVPTAPGLAVLVTGHLQRRVENRQASWHPLEEASVVYWVQDGVVVERTRLKGDFQCVSLGIFVSSEKLASDASGFTLQKSLEWKQRLWQVCRLAGLFLSEVDLERNSVVEAVRSRQLTFGGLVGVTGLGLSLVLPVNGLLMFGAGLVIAGTRNARVEERALDQLDKTLQRLREEWSQRYLSNPEADKESP